MYRQKIRGGKWQIKKMRKIKMYRERSIKEGISNFYIASLLRVNSEC